MVAVETGGITVSSGMKMRAAMALAVVADILQMALFPLFIEGGVSPVDDVLDLAMAGILTYLLGWHWEFAPSFIGKLVPGVDFVPLWSLAVGNVWRKSKHIEANEPSRYPAPVIEGEPVRRK
ncbi:hypothetical protein [Occallatibacter savannae]|uniref:hypothetical protein n=1 Tax=Occallatibacter savannae TaxID=1002691 RepID=UPI000D688C0D|nr:hypothetical protein [Occallatibacter savannae]